MRRLICAVLAAALLAGICLAWTAIAEDEDDSVMIPVDLEEEKTEVQAFRVLQSGDSGDDVIFLQTRLEDLKYFSGEIDGQYSQATEKAVKSFQQDFSMEATGIADLETQMVLYTTTYRPLKYGATGEDVKELQTRLTALGYYKGQIKGNFLEATQKAVERFQEANGLTVTGIADPDTQEILFSYGAIGNYDEPTPTPSPIPDLNNYQVDDDENSVPLPNEPVAFTKKLKNGSSGKLVKQMQQRLCDLGYLDKSKVSGNFQKYTTRAVKAIQTQNGMKDTGVVDEATWNIIFNESHVVLQSFEGQYFVIRGVKRFFDLLTQYGQFVDELLTGFFRGIVDLQSQ